VRDEGSAELLAECGVPRSRVHIAADPAVAVDPSSAGPELTFSSAPRPWVAINLRPWGDESQPGQLVARGTAIARAIREQLGGSPVLLPLQRAPEDDLRVLEPIASATGAVLVQQTLSPPEAVGLLAQFDLLVGMRLHASVLALAAGKPFVALSYDPKVSGFAQRVGLSEHVHGIGGLDDAAVVHSCQALLQDAGLPARLEASRRELRERARLSAEIASELLSPGRARAPRPAVAPDTRPSQQIRVLMRIRPDYRERPGGDTVQMEQTRLALERLGVRVTVSGAESPDLSQFDVVHAFNLGRPEEPHRHCLEAVAAGKPVALSTVYWDFSEFWEWGDPDYWDLPAPENGAPMPRRAPLPDPIELRRRARLDELRRTAIECAAVYLPNGQGEAQLLSRTYGMDLSRTIVVTNAVDEVFFSARPEPFVERHGLRDFVLCAARVEKRKNQLLLIAALRGTGIPLVIIGQPNPEEYRELCRRYADENVLFLDALPQEELASACAAAKVHALPGWFETPGLSTLEAAAAGCNIVTTDRGTAREYLGDPAWYCNPRDLESIRTAVLSAYEAARSQRLKALVRERYTWDRAAESTLEGYRLALGLHARRDDRARCELEVAAVRAHADYLARLAADRGYEAEQMRAWGQAADGELKGLQAEFQRVTSGRLHRWSSAVARAGWGVLRALGVTR